MAERPEQLLDVAAFEIGTSAPSEQPAVAVRFHLRDGSTLAVALRAELAAGLYQRLLETLRELADRPPPASH